MKLPKIIGVRFSDGDEFYFPDPDDLITKHICISKDECFKEVSLIFLKADPEMHRKHIHELREAEVIYDFGDLEY